MTPSEIETFRRTIFDFYRRHARRLPWRETDDPYRVYISEIMLQQTQVDRVIPKYDAFLFAFPSVHTLARARFTDVLSVWSGLGYNRRALHLHKAAKQIVENHDGEIPSDPSVLRTLPGIGPYTAAAIAVFAYGKPFPLIETNVRRAYIHEFFVNCENVKDGDIMPLVEETLDRDNPREWFYALMDYGAMLKIEVGNANRRSAHYTKQAPFEGSDRQIRGELLRELGRGKMNEHEIPFAIRRDAQRVTSVIADLCNEGFLVRDGDMIQIA